MKHLPRRLTAEAEAQSGNQKYQSKRKKKKEIKLRDWGVGVQ